VVLLGTDLAGIAADVRYGLAPPFEWAGRPIRIGA
jgi:hypothetical protein